MNDPTRQRLSRAMDDPDRVVVIFEYQDQQGNCTRRVASPIRFSSATSFLALCLCREEPRRFELARCRNLRLAAAHEFSMPVPIVSVPQMTGATNNVC